MFTFAYKYNVCICRQYVIIIICLIERKMRFVFFFKFQSTKLQICAYDLFIFLEESQDDLGIPKSHDLDHFNEYFSCLLQPSSVLTLQKTKKKQSIKTYVQ